MIQQHRQGDGGAPLPEAFGGRESHLLADVTEMAETVMESADPPPGFVRREIPVGGKPAQVFARISGDSEGSSPTVVVVIPDAWTSAPSPSEIRRRFGLTPREAEVALMLASRRSNKEIAGQLRIAQNTAWRHTERVLAKLNAGSRRDVRKALESAVPA